MIYSMTGYGEAGGQISGQDYTVEIKTVNNRYLRTVIKLPENCTFAEEQVEKLLRDNISRGTVNYVLRSRGSSSQELFDIDEAALTDLVKRLDHIRRSTGIDSRLDLAGLMMLPGIVQAAAPTDETAEQIVQGVLDLSRQALEKLREMRLAEGSFLHTDLRQHCEAIRKDLQFVTEHRGVIVQEYAEKVRKRVDELLAQAKLKLDADTLAREVAILAERSDIAEELSRLESHLVQFEQTCDSAKEQVGRRLDFIAQEMLREANTIASKANDAEICNRVVNIKCSIDRIKEQIQNVE